MKTTPTDYRQGIRNRIRAQRRQLEPAFVQAASAAVQASCFSLSKWQSAENVCCYLAMPIEVQTDIIIQKCGAERKQLSVPVFLAHTRKYGLALFDPDEEVSLGRFNVLEPASPKWIKSQKIDLVFVPGLAFDRRGNRLGHGCGYYDDLLAREPLCWAYKVGLAFDFQLFDRLPARGADVRMDEVITESGVYRAG